MKETFKVAIGLKLWWLPVISVRFTEGLKEEKHVDEIVEKVDGEGECVDKTMYLWVVIHQCADPVQLTFLAFGPRHHY